MKIILRIINILIFIIFTKTLFGNIEIETPGCLCEGNIIDVSINIEAEDDNDLAEPFSFYWTGPNGYSSVVQNPDDISTAGFYSVIITNAYGCETTLTTEIVLCEGIDEIQLTPTNTCIGGMNGSVQLSITGGVEPFTYQWSNGASTEIIKDLNGGEYCVTVTDSNGCTAEGCATVNSEQVLSLALTSTNTCVGSSEGAASVFLAEGGTMPYTYLWTNGETTASIDNLPAGNYWLTLTDADGCSYQSYTEVENLNVPVILEYITPSSCESIADGSISLNIGGGDPPHTFLWDNGETTSTITDLIGGDYCVTVTTVSGCNATACFSTSPDEAQIQAPYLKKVQVYTQAVADDSQTLIYDAEWVPAASGCIVFTGGMQSISDELFISMQNEEQELMVEVTPNTDLQGLSLTLQEYSITEVGFDNGVWSFTVPSNNVSGLINNEVLNVGLKFIGQDTYGNELIDLRAASIEMSSCTKIPTLQEDCNWSPNQPTGIDDVHVLERSCEELFFSVNNISNSISVSMPDGLAPFTYNWTGPNGFTDNVFKITPQGSGEYCVVVADAAGCKAMGCINYCIGFAEAVEQANFISITPTCPDGTGGSICLDETIGGFPIEVNWIGGPQNSLCWENLNMGIYQVEIKELFCNESITISIKLDESIQSLPSATLLSSTPSCPGFSNGELCVSLTGGKPPYSLLWETGSETTCIEGLTSGECYNLTVTDACGQSIVNCFEIPIYDASNFTVNADVQESCEGVSGGSIILTVTGGNEPYTYSWAPSGMLQIPSVPNRNNLTPGIYPVTVSDACGTLFSAEYEVGTISNEEGFIEIDDVFIKPSCGNPLQNGSVSIEVSTASGGNPLTYEWSNGGVGSSLSHLQPGIYTVTISNSYGCALIESYEVPDNFFENHSVNIIDACGSSPGSIKINSTPLWCTFDYSWSTGEITTTENYSEIVDLEEGMYCVTITSNNCGGTEAPCHIVERCFEIVQNPPIELPSSVVSIKKACEEGAGGAIEIKGLQPLSWNYQYLWSTGQTSNEIAGLSPGEYCVTVTAPEMNCSYEDCFEVLDVEAPVLEIVESFPDHINAAGIHQSDGGAIVVVEGGNSPYTFEWSNGSISQNLTGVQAGFYAVTVTDDNGCTDETFIEISACHTTLNIDLVNFTYPSATGEGSIFLAVTGQNLSNLSYEWTGPNGFSSNYQNISNLYDSGEYFLTVTNNCGVSATFSQMLINCEAVFVELNVSNPCNNPYFPDAASLYISRIYLPLGSDYIDFVDEFTFEWGRYNSNNEWQSLSTETSQIIPVGPDENPSWIVQDNDARRLTPILFTREYCVRVYNDVCPTSITEVCYEFKSQYNKKSWFWWDDISGTTDDYENNFVVYPYFDEFHKAITNYNECETCLPAPYFNGPSDCEEDRISYRLNYKPPNYITPCLGGGTIILYEDSGFEEAFAVPDLSWGILADNGGEKCGCYFPPGMIPDINLPNSTEALPVYVEFDCEPEEPPIIADEDCHDGFDGECELGCETNFVGVSTDGYYCQYETICLDNNVFLGYSDLLSLSCYKAVYYPYSGNGGGGYLYDVYSFCTCEEGGFELQYEDQSTNQGLPECPCDVDSDGYAPDDNEYYTSNPESFEGSKLRNFEPLKERDYQLNGYSNQLGINIYPNPFNSEISFDLLSDRDQIADIRILNTLGQEIISSKLNLVIGRNANKISIQQDLPEGMYFVSIEDDKGVTQIFKLMHTSY